MQISPNYSSQLYTFKICSTNLYYDASSEVIIIAISAIVAYLMYVHSYAVKVELLTVILLW